MLLEAGSGSDVIGAISQIFTQVSGTFSVANIVSILGVVIGASIGLVLMWFGLRKVIRVIMAAFRKGKVSV